MVWDEGKCRSGVWKEEKWILYEQNAVVVAVTILLDKLEGVRKERRINSREIVRK
jgi:hypothetical protein